MTEMMFDDRQQAILESRRAKQKLDRQKEEEQRKLREEQLKRLKFLESRLDGPATTDFGGAGLPGSAGGAPGNVNELEKKIPVGVVDGVTYYDEIAYATALADYNAGQREKAAISRERAALEAQKAAQLEAAKRQKTSAKASLQAWLGTFFDPTKDADTITQLMNFVNSQIEQDIPADAVMLNIRSQDFYQKRFFGNKALREAGLAELTPAEYLAAERTYDEILQSAGLGNLSNRSNFAKLIGGRVSAKEAQDRITNVYGRIANADTALRDEIKRLNQFGNITAADFAESLLTGKEGAASLQRKITQAEISTEFTQRGLTSATGIEELERLGVTRAKAAAGAEYAAQGTRRLQDLATIYGAETTGIQQELESEAFRGLESQRRKLLVSQERAAAAGRAGTGTPSLTVSASGEF